MAGFTTAARSARAAAGQPGAGPCETWIVGNAKDTGKPGPTWTVNGQYCTGPASGCEHHPTEPRMR